MRTIPEDAVQKALSELREIHRKSLLPSRDHDAEDPEGAHVEADMVLKRLLRDIGLGEVADAYEAIQPKWYG